jgi:DNA polymerase III subunit beta
MRIICSQSDLKTNLSLVSRVVPSRPTHPVLANVLLEADQESGRINLTGFDLSLGMRTSLDAQIIEGGSLTVPAKLMNDIVSRLPEGEITLINENGDENQSSILQIQSASGSFQVRGMDAEEYPELPTIEDGDTLSLPIEALMEGLKGTAFAASTDDSKQVLTGVHFIGSQDSLELAATDGHRLSMIQTSVEGTNEDEDEETTTFDLKDFEATIPARALREVEKMLTTAQDDEQLILHVDESQVIFELGRQRLTSRKLEGTYPSYRQLIPTQFKRQMTVDRKRLLNALELVAVLADQKNNIVKFTIDSEKEQLSLSVDAKDVGSGKQILPAEITGDSLQIGFNVKYLMDGLKALPSDEVTIHFNESTQPVIFNPLSGVKMTYLVMPVQLRD